MLDLLEKLQIWDDTALILAILGYGPMWWLLREERKRLDLAMKAQEKTGDALKAIELVLVRLAERIK